MKAIKNRYHAETLFCKLFVEAAGALEAHALSAETLRVVEECEFGDPHFIGGPATFDFAKTPNQVERIFDRAEPFVAELCGALQGVNPSKAQTFRASIGDIKAWMLRNV